MLLMFSISQQPCVTGVLYGQDRRQGTPGGRQHNTYDARSCGHRHSFKEVQFQPCLDERSVLLNAVGEVAEGGHLRRAR